MASLVMKIDVPGDMLTSSASGLDPDITMKNAEFQLDWSPQNGRRTPNTMHPLCEVKSKQFCNATRLRLSTVWLSPRRGRERVRLICERTSWRIRYRVGGRSRELIQSSAADRIAPAPAKLRGLVEFNSQSKNSENQ
jgi:K+-transporting ATPase, c chain